MSRYLLVKSNYRPKETQTSPTSWNNDYVECPWTWQEHIDVNRLPYKTVYAQCLSSCHEWFCKPVKYRTMVLIRDGNEWKIQQEEITVAYIYSE